MEPIHADHQLKKSIRPDGLLTRLFGGRGRSFEEERKRSVLALFLGLGTLTLFPFAVHHALLGHELRSGILLFVGSVQFASLIGLHYLEKSALLFRVNVLLLGAYLLFLLIVGGSSGARALWAFVFPWFSFFLLGKREGLLWNTVFFGFSLLLFWDPATLFGTSPYAPEFQTRFLMAYAIIVFMCYVVETTRLRYQAGMEEARSGLEASVAKRTAALREANAKLKKEIGDRIMAEEALQSAEREKEVILSSLSEHVIHEDRDMHILWANRAACESAGMSLEALIGRYCYEIWPERQDPCPDCPVIQAMETGNSHEVGKETPDGRTWLIRGDPVRGKNGEIIGGIEVTLEITDRKKAEAALKEAYTILNMSPATAFLWKNEKGWPVEFVTDNVEVLTGYSAQEWLSGEIQYERLIHPEDLPRVAREVTHHSRDPQCERLTHEPYRILTKDGHKKWVEDRTQIRRNPKGKITHYDGIVLDITNRLQIRDALRESEERFRTLVEQSPLGVSLIGLDGRHRYVNPMFLEIFGYGLEEIAEGKAWLEKAYPDPERRQHVAAMWKKDVREMKSGEMRQRAYDVVCKGGVEKNITFRVMKLETGENLVIYEDTTEQKRLEAQLIQAQKMEAIGTMAGGIAHDFNNLLMGVQGRASLMRLDMDPTDPHVEHLRGIEEYIRSATHLTRQLLGFARGGKYEVKPTDMNALVDRIADLFGRTRKEISLHRKFEEALWPADVDRRQMEQVLLNLFVNAWQAMPTGGEIFLQTQNVSLEEGYARPQGVRGGRYIKISVTDTGVGMDEATQQRIFDPFFTTKTMGRGTGLGLASAYGIAKNHEGIITVYSEKGHGSTFNIYLPASSEDNAVEESDPTEEIIMGEGTILLVDDEEVVLEVAKPLLENIGYEVIVARSGKEGIELYRQYQDRIRCVIMDMVMPQMSGGETFDRLRAIHPQVKVLLSSGYSINGQAQEILNRGCKGFIQKPFHLEELSRKLQETLGSE